MYINFELYKNFYYVVQCSSISKASQVLGVTQSALSQSIKQIENLFGKQLFIRSPKGVVLTKCGQKLYDLIFDSVRTFQNAHRLLKQSEDEFQINFGANDLVARLYILPKLHLIYEKFPNIKIRILNPTNLNNRLNLISEGIIDIALLKNANNFDDKFLKTEKIDELEYCFFYNPNNLTINENMPLKDLYKLPIVMKSYRTQTLNDFNAINKGVKLNSVIEVDSDNLIIDLIKNLKYVGYAPKKIIDKDYKIINIADIKPVKSIISAICNNQDEKVKSVIDLLI